MDPDPTPQMLFRLGDVGFGHVEPESRKARPRLLDEIEEASSAAANIEKPEAALVATGEDLMQRRQGLAPDRIGGAFEQHLDLGVVALGGVPRHPAAGLEMKILQIVVRPPAAQVRAAPLAIPALLAPALDGRKVGKKQSRMVEQDGPRAVVIRRQRIEASFHI